MLKRAIYRQLLEHQRAQTPPELVPHFQTSRGGRSWTKCEVGNVCGYGLGLGGLTRDVFVWDLGTLFRLIEWW